MALVKNQWLLCTPGTRTLYKVRRRTNTISHVNTMTCGPSSSYAVQRYQYSTVQYSIRPICRLYHLSFLAAELLFRFPLQVDILLLGYWLSHRRVDLTHLAFVSFPKSRLIKTSSRFLLLDLPAVCNYVCTIVPN